MLLALSAILFASIGIIGVRARKAQKLAQHNEKLAFLGQTSAELAHELKNPLAIIKSSVDVLRRKHDPEKIEKPFEFISEEILRVSRLVDDILSFSREKRLLLEPFSPIVVLETVLVSLGNQYPDIKIAVNISDKLRLIGDKDAFVQIASNLVRNAAAAMNSRGRIEISAQQQKSKLFIDFSDNGPGIPGEIVPHLFEPFVSGSRTGTGLGLSIVRALCEASGWDIRLVSHGRGNTCFRIIIKEKLWQKS
jgi:two-component system sensor histidine kinase AtoS